MGFAGRLCHVLTMWERQSYNLAELQTPACKMGFSLPSVSLKGLNEVRGSEVRGSTVLVYNLDLDSAAKLARYESQLYLFATRVTSRK